MQNTHFMCPVDIFYLPFDPYEFKVLLYIWYKRNEKNESDISINELNEILRISHKKLCFIIRMLAYSNLIKINGFEFKVKLKDKLKITLDENEMFRFIEVAKELKNKKE